MLVSITEFKHIMSLDSLTHLKLCQFGHILTQCIQTSQTTDGLNICISVWINTKLTGNLSVLIKGVPKKLYIRNLKARREREGERREGRM